MRGLTFQGIEQVEFCTDLADPILQCDSDVIVQVHRAGICGSDLHQFHGREPVAVGTIPGHEFVGEVVAVGSAIRGFQTGDQVFSPFTTCCGECFFCNNGLSGRCHHWQAFGYLPPNGVDDHGRGIQGAQAEFVRVPLADSTLVRVPESMTLEQAILLGDNFTTGFFCADMGGIRRDGITVVIGCGAVGLSAIVAARFLGAEQIVAVDPVESRRAKAAELGAMTVTPEAARDLISQLAAPTGRQGADTILEAVGNPTAQKLAFELVRPGGVISAVGMHTANDFAFSPADAYNHNITYRAGRCPVRSYLNRILTAIEQKQLWVPTELIITHTGRPIYEGSAAYAEFSSRTGNCIKTLLDPTAVNGAATT